MQAYLFYFVVFGTFGFAKVLEYVLAEKNISYMKTRFEDLPEKVALHLDRMTYEKSQRYSLEKASLARVAALYSGLVTLVILLTVLPGMWDNAVSTLIEPGILRGVVYILSALLFITAVNIPFSWYRTFRIEEKFGFNKTTLRTWVMDILKGLGLGAVIGVPIIAGVLWFMNVAGSLWWFYAWLFLVGMQIVLQAVAPVWIMPLFNTFTPLEDGELKDAVLGLADRLGFETSGVYVADGSLRSGHANAYFAGIGRNRRIVLYDTLIEKLSTEEVCAVLAHEIGHARSGHVKKMMVESAIIYLLTFIAIHAVMQIDALYTLGGFREQSIYAALVMFLLVSEPFGTLLTPLLNRTSRKHEYEADRFAVDAMNSATPLVDGLLSLSRSSLSNMNPHPWYSTFYYSHPALVERIEAMRTYENSAQS